MGEVEEEEEEEEEPHYHCPVAPWGGAVLNCKVTAVTRPLIDQWSVEGRHVDQSQEVAHTEVVTINRSAPARTHAQTALKPLPPLPTDVT